MSLEAIVAPDNVKLVDDPETVIATLSAPRLQTESDEEIESETQVVGEGGGEAEATRDESARDGDADSE